MLYWAIVFTIGATVASIYAFSDYAGFGTLVGQALMYLFFAAALFSGYRATQQSPSR